MNLETPNGGKRHKDVQCFVNTGIEGLFEEQLVDHPLREWGAERRPKGERGDRNDLQSRYGCRGMYEAWAQ